MSEVIQIDQNLILRSVRDQEEAERWAEFNGTYNNPHEGKVCACLVRHHPHMQLSNFWLVEDTSTHEIVSTTCLIPWKANFCGIDLRLTQLEMVLTHPAYRGRGLVRKQIDHFHQQVISDGYDLSIIWGIPYYYRQFGYTYTLFGQAAETLNAWQIPEPPIFGDRITVRPAGLEDIEDLSTLYELKTSRFDFYTRFDRETWTYLLQHARLSYEIICSQDQGIVLGYAFCQRDAEWAAIYDSAFPDPTTAMAYLTWLKSCSLRGIKVDGAFQPGLVQAARSLGSIRSPESQWLVRVPDFQAFLTRLTPVFNIRLAESGYRSLNFSLTLNLYTQAFRLHFTDNRLSSVEKMGFVDYSMGADGGDLCIPPDAFTRLLTGYRSLEQLRDAWPDIIVKPHVQSLVDALFPRLTADLFTPYQPLE